VSARAPRVLASVLAVSLVVASGAHTAHGQEHCGGGFACEADDWRFVLHDRPVKVVLLAGSIGAFQDQPYARHLHEWCTNAEIRNLSRVGFGASQLYGVFQREVLRNPRFPFGHDDVELWLMWNGGLNSAANAARTNSYIRRTFVDAHRRGMRIVGLSLTPWGGFSDEHRWGGARALETLGSTRRIVDFVMGRGTAADLLGTYATQRTTADAPWQPNELADVRVDLFDSALRNRDAAARDVGQMRDLVSRDSRWRHAVSALAEPARTAQLETDARTLSEVGRWFLRPELRSFDPIHPNRDGHQRIAELVCPTLPASWGCHCP
jgi:hypothetical protein